MPNYFPEGDQPSARDDTGDESRSLQKINSLLYALAYGGNSGGGLVVNEATLYTVAATGSGYTLLANKPARIVEVANSSGYTLLVQRGGAGAAWPIPPNGSKTFSGITNSNQLGVKADGLGAGTVTITYEVQN